MDIEKNNPVPSQKKISAASVILAVSALVILLFAFQPNEPVKVKVPSSLPGVEQYQEEMADRFTRILFGENALPKKVYTISDTALAAPMPDQTCYGEVEDPKELQPLLERAEEILEGQRLLFSTDVEILEGSTVHYYMDETILAIIWKQSIHRAVFTFSEVKVLHSSQFRRYLSGGEFGSGTLARTTEMSASVNAVVACSADYYAYRRPGMTVTEGTVHKNVNGVKDACFIDRNGDMILERGLTFENIEEAQKYVDEHNVNFGLSFGPILVQDGEYACPRSYSLGEITVGFPRAAICQMDKLHYLFVASNVEPHNYYQMTMAEFAEQILATGCRNAYALDGGQTATVAMNNTLINQVNYGSQRMISDIIYFATAKPAGA